MKRFFLMLCTIAITLSLQQLKAQEFTVHGTVTDGNEPLIGVSVRVDGTTTGVITDFEGKYSLTFPNKSSKLIFSYIGYVTLTEVIKGRTVINVVMKENVQALDEIVVVGYGTSTVKDLTSSVASVKTKNLDKAAAASIDDMLQGRVAGLNMSFNSAQPGAGLSINIRGSISPNGNNQPLYVIDGVPMTTNTANVAELSGGVMETEFGIDQSPLNTINPSDIESIDVLKDASAAAIYGSSSANGVILITTKRGKQGKPRIEYAGSYTMQVQKPYAHDLLNASEWMRQRNLWNKEQALYTANIYPYGTVDYNGDGIADAQDYNQFMAEQKDEFSSTDIAAIGKGTDWLDYVTRNGHIQEHNVSITGGNNETKYFMSYNYFEHEGLLRNSGMNRHTARINLDQQIGKRIKVGIGITYSDITNKTVGTGKGPIGQGHFNMLQAAYAFPPNFDDSIDPNTDSYVLSYDTKLANPAAYLTIEDKSNNSRIFMNPTVEVNILKDLVFKAVGGYDKQINKRKYYIPSYAGFYLAPKGLAQISERTNINKSIEGYFTYNATFHKVHRINAVLGFGAYSSTYETAYMQGVDFFTDSFGTDNIGINTNADKRYISTSRGEMSKYSQFIRLNYTYKDRYTFSFTGRNDGSSVFAAKKKWGFFPSVSAAWRISEESFMENTTNYLSNLKLRIGYGTSGNEPSRANALAIYSSGYNVLQGDGYHTGVQLTQLANDYLSWETNATLNVGLDFGFFNQRLTGNIDYFVRTAKDLIDYKTLPANNPVTKIISNIGSTQSKGIEFMLTSQNVQTKDVSWSTTFNISHALYKWIERNPELVLNAWEKTKGEMSAVYGWKTDGIFHNFEEINAYVNKQGEKIQPLAIPGNIKYVDINGDGVLDDKDMTKLGRTTPSIRAGLGNSISYKNFDLSFYFYGAFGHIKSRGDIGQTGSLTPSTPYNSYKTISDVWSTQNPDGIYPGIGTDATSAQQRSGSGSDFWYMKGNYVKLKNITLGYNVPQQWLKGSFINSLKLSVDAQNLWTITNYFGFDPELNGTNPYPQAYSFTFGLRAIF